MIKTDPLTGFLAHKFVTQEEEKNRDKTLYKAMRKLHAQLANSEIDGPETDFIVGFPPAAVSAAAALIRERTTSQITKAVEHLADTLALARDVHEDPTEKRLKKLSRMADQAAGDQETILALVNGAIELVDFEHIAETLLGVGKRMAEATEPAEAS